MEKQEMACHFVSNSYEFHHKENSLILKFVIKKNGKLQLLISHKPEKNTRLKIIYVIFGMDTLQRQSNRMVG